MFLTWDTDIHTYTVLEVFNFRNTTIILHFINSFCLTFHCRKQKMRHWDVNNMEKIIDAV